MSINSFRILSNNPIAYDFKCLQLVAKAGLLFPILKNKNG
jgi:hypothetical protein